MGITITKKIDLKKFLPEIQEGFVREGKETLADEIAAHIISGKSPVKGKRFKKYSKSYAKVKGRTAPVDMLDSGQMLESLRVVKKRTGAISIFFRNRLAEIHNTLGAGKKKVIRRLLPDKKGEQFSPTLIRSIVRRMKLITKKAISKQNR